MIQAIEVQVDKQAVRESIEKQLDKAIAAQLWFVDVERISTLTNMSRRFLESEILNDPRMKIIERKKARKRFYPAEQAFKVIDEITSGW